MVSIDGFCIKYFDFSFLDIFFVHFLKIKKTFPKFVTLTLVFPATSSFESYKNLLDYQAIPPINGRRVYETSQMAPSLRAPAPHAIAHTFAALCPRVKAIVFEHVRT